MSIKKEINVIIVIVSLYKGLAIVSNSELGVVFGDVCKKGHSALLVRWDFFLYYTAPCRLNARSELGQLLYCFNNYYIKERNMIKQNMTKKNESYILIYIYVYRKYRSVDIIKFTIHVTCSHIYWRNI